MNTSRMLQTYYSQIEKIQSFYGVKRTRSAKSQFLAKLKKDMEIPEFKTSTSMLNFMLIHTNGMVNMKDFILTCNTSIYEEVLHQYKHKAQIHAHDMFADWRDIDEVITMFNRNYLLPTPTDIASLKIYDKRLKAMLEKNTINRTTIYFLLYLIYSE